MRARYEPVPELRTASDDRGRVRVRNQDPRLARPVGVHLVDVDPVAVDEVVVVEPLELVVDRTALGQRGLAAAAQVEDGESPQHRAAVELRAGDLLLERDPGPVR